MDVRIRMYGSGRILGASRKTRRFGGVRSRSVGALGVGARPKDLDNFVELVGNRSTIKGNPSLALRPEIWSNITYRDNAFDLAMTAAFRAVMGAVAGWQSKKPFLPSKSGQSYEGLIEVAQALQWGKGSEAFEDAVIEVLARFPRQPQLLQNNKISMELLGFLTPRLFAFLVGPSKVQEWKRDDGSVWKSEVKIEKCRFLTKSNCAGMCVGLCQRPTQRFFNEVAGLPMAMEPNFDDCSCTMTWGKTPKPKEEDPAGLQACFEWCPSKPAQPQSQSLSQPLPRDDDGEIDLEAVIDSELGREQTGSRSDSCTGGIGVDVGTETSGSSSRNRAMSSSSVCPRMSRL